MTPPDRPTSAAPATASPRMREQVLTVAEDFYVLRGYNGFSFAHIAQAVQTTRANIHHHFGDKRQLMAELIDKFARDAERRINHHWVDGDAGFSARMRAQLDDLREVHRRFNPEPGSRNVWSPLSRLRLDLPVLGELAEGALHRVDQAYERSLGAAVRAAVARGELPAATSADDVARVLRMMLLSCAPMTQDSGDFRQIEQLFASMERIVAAAPGAASG